MQIVFPYYVVDKRRDEASNVFQSFAGCGPSCASSSSNGSKKIFRRFLSTRVELQYFSMNDSTTRSYWLRNRWLDDALCIYSSANKKIETDGTGEGKEVQILGSWSDSLLTDRAFQLCPLLPLSNCYFTFFFITLNRFLLLRRFDHQIDKFSIEKFDVIWILMVILVKKDSCHLEWIDEMMNFWKKRKENSILFDIIIW